MLKICFRGKIKNKSLTYQKWHKEALKKYSLAEYFKSGDSQALEATASKSWRARSYCLFNANIDPAFKSHLFA